MMSNKPINKTILFVSAGLEAIPAIQRAKQLGLTVVVSDRDEYAPGFQYADYKIIADTYNAQETLREATQLHEQTQSLDGVLCVAADVPKTVATVTQTLGLPGITLETAMLASDKLLMKDQFKRDGVPIPWYSAIDSIETLKDLVNEKGFPLVLKPVDSRGARGVLRLTENVDLEWAYHESIQHSPTNRLMLEKYLDGPQVSTESIVIDGVAHTPGFSDRNYEFLEKYAPYIVENGGDLPSFLDEAIQTKVIELVQHAANSMGVVNGVIKGDIVVHQGGAYVIEMATRLSGGYFCTHEIPLNTGVDFIACAIRQAVGENVDPAELQPQYQRCISQRYLFPQPGTVTGVAGEDDVVAQDHVEFLDIRVKPGDTVYPMHNHPARAGMVIASGESREQAIGLAEQVVHNIQIETQ